VVWLLGIGGALAAPAGARAGLLLLGAALLGPVVPDGSLGLPLLHEGVELLRAPRLAEVAPLVLLGLGQLDQHLLDECLGLHLQLLLVLSKLASDGQQLAVEVVESVVIVIPDELHLVQ
ncbi:hypothetical protein DC007_14660, partial [Enterococcus faecalis]